MLAEFGPNLENATPANVREFLDRMQMEAFAPNIGNRINLDEPAKSYEEIIKDFFARILELPHEEALITLWTLALELSFAAIESHLSERFAVLFKDLDSEMS